jgi:hypothetical protein
MNIDQLRDLHAKCVAFAESGEKRPYCIVELFNGRCTFWVAYDNEGNSLGRIGRWFNSDHESDIIQFAKVIGLYEESQPEQQGLYPVGTRAKVGDMVRVVANMTGHPAEIGSIAECKGILTVEDENLFVSGATGWSMTLSEYVIIAEAGKPIEAKPKGIDPVLVQLTCAALSGLLANPSLQLSYMEIFERSVRTAQGTYDELRK